MNNINIFVGENLEDLNLCKGGYDADQKENLPFINTENKCIHVDMMSATREFPEIRKHPRKFGSELRLDIQSMLGSYEFNIMTHSTDVIEIIAEMIFNKSIPREKVKVYIVTKDNKDFGKVSLFDDEGCLVDWPCFFFDTN